MKIIQRYSRAVNSKSLQDDDQHHQTEVLAAIALSSNLGSLLYRAKFSGDSHSILPLLGIWRIMVLKRAKRGGWQKTAEEVADISLWYWLDNLCQVCSGRGHPIIINTPTLEAATCQECQGSGIKKLVCDAGILEFVKNSVQALESISSEAGLKAQKKLR